MKIKRPPEAFHLKGEDLPARGCIIYPTLPQPPPKDKMALKHYRPDFDLTHPDDWPEWVKNMHTEHAAVEVTKDGVVIWWGGTIHDGIWFGGYFMGGRFRDGIWLDGVFYDGMWTNGEWRGGTFLNGIWSDGLFRDGKFCGYWRGGVFMGGEFNGFWQRTRVPPPPNFSAKVLVE
jgi:hypothetical protein